MSGKDDKHQYNVNDRWVAVNLMVWEKRIWGWKFIGVAESQNPQHILKLVPTDCDHPEDIYFRGQNER